VNRAEDPACKKSAGGCTMNWWPGTARGGIHFGCELRSDYARSGIGGDAC
jgi:hypothetical protein